MKSGSGRGGDEMGGGGGGAGLFVMWVVGRGMILEGMVKGLRIWSSRT